MSEVSDLVKGYTGPNPFRESTAKSFKANRFVAEFTR